MSANRRRGEIDAEFDDKRYRLCLTLGALAELEASYAADDLAALVTRFSSGKLSAFSSGKLSASDLIRIIGSGLRGAGNAIADDEVATMQCPRGVAGFAEVAAELLAVTFGTGKADPSPNP